MSKRTRQWDRRRRAAAAAAALVALASGCASPSMKGGVYEDPDVHYALAEPGGDWAPVKIGGANAAWHNARIGAAILVNSHCDGVEDSPLEALTRDLTIGMTEREELSSRRFEMSRREALETMVSAKLDGVPRRLLILVLKKDGCVYDVVLDASPEAFDEGKSAYEKVRDSLDVHPRPGH